MQYKEVINMIKLTKAGKKIVENAEKNRIKREENLKHFHDTTNRFILPPIIK